MESRLFNHRFEDDVCIINFVRELVSPEISELVKSINPILEEKNTRGILFNLSGDILIDSVLVGFLITTLKECQNRGIKYALCEIDKDFIGIFKNLQNMKLSQFLGIFESESEAMKNFQELVHVSKPSRKNHPFLKNRVVTKETFYLVGPKTNWKFSRNQLTALGILFIGIFLTIIGITTYQHFFYQSLFAEIRQNDEELRIGNGELTRITKELEQQHIVLEQQIDQKKFLLSLAQKATPPNQPKDEALQKKEEAFQKQITEKKTILDTKTAAIDKLKNEYRQSLRRIRFLKQNTNDMEKLLEEQKKQIRQQSSVTPPTTIPFRHVEASSLTIEQFKMTSKANSFSIRFNLRNTSSEVRSGNIMILALREEDLDQMILFDSDQSMTFTIRRFRSFSQDFVQNPNSPYIAVALIVWNQNRKKVLEEHYLVE
ncbi:MAG: STAS domain-containing protein [SAR324 cluster bacterium]|nr:STAS domain-containing protein [SAR324 cluster bacterium]